MVIRVEKFRRRHRHRTNGQLHVRQPGDRKCRKCRITNEQHVRRAPNWITFDCVMLITCAKRHNIQEGIKVYTFYLNSVSAFFRFYSLKCNEVFLYRLDALYKMHLIDLLSVLSIWSLLHPELPARYSVMNTADRLVCWRFPQNISDTASFLPRGWVLDSDADSGGAHSTLEHPFFRYLVEITRVMVYNGRRKMSLVPACHRLPKKSSPCL